MLLPVRVALMDQVVFLILQQAEHFFCLMMRELFWRLHHKLCALTVSCFQLRLVPYCVYCDCLEHHLPLCWSHCKGNKRYYPI